MTADITELTILLQSGAPIVQIETHEEVRILRILSEIATRTGSALHVWTIADGLRRYSESPSLYAMQDLKGVLVQIKDREASGVFVIIDGAPHLKDPVCERLIKEIAEEYPKKPRTLIFLSSSAALPEDLARMSSRFTPKLPDSERIQDIYLEQAYRWLSEKIGRRLFRDNEAERSMLRNLSGLTEEDVENLVSSAIRNDGRISFDDAQHILDFKKQAIGKEGLIEFVPDATELTEVGGLASLKTWLSMRRSSFLGDGKATGLPPPKGVLLIGIQGCGKSLAAKAVATAWQVPLMRLDFGVLYSKWLGETEHNIREAFRQIEAMAPCVLWLDEIEKGLSSDAGGSTDGGVSRRILAALLVWMAERTSQVFLVATANDVSQLPPELIRKGRLDEIFFIELPSPSEREEIFRIHLKKLGFYSADLDIDSLIPISENFSGSEIEQLVISAMYKARTLDVNVTTESLVTEILQTKPLAVVMSEKVTALRAWAAGRTVPAA